MEAVILHARKQWDYFFKVSRVSFFQARILKSVKSLLRCSVMRFQSQWTQCRRWGREGPGTKLCRGLERNKARLKQKAWWSWDRGSRIKRERRLNKIPDIIECIRETTEDERKMWKIQKKKIKRCKKKKRKIHGIRLTSKANYSYIIIVM